MKVWIVLEEDRGIGPTVWGVYTTEEEANHNSGCGALHVDGPHDVQGIDAPVETEPKNEAA